jgi:hypothetical protein
MQQRLTNPHLPGYHAYSCVTARISSELTRWYTRCFVWVPADWRLCMVASLLPKFAIACGSYSKSRSGISDNLTQLQRPWRYHAILPFMVEFMPHALPFLRVCLSSRFVALTAVEVILLQYVEAVPSISWSLSHSLWRLPATASPIFTRRPPRQWSLPSADFSFNSTDVL